jgi:hypothetical protein
MGYGVIKVTREIHKELGAIRSSGIIDMIDIQGVIDISKALGYREMAKWIEENKKAYLKGLAEGFYF